LNLFSWSNLFIWIQSNRFQQLVFLILFIFKLILLTNESFYLKINQKSKLFYSHPIRKDKNKRNITYLHFIGSLIKISLSHLKMKLLCILIAVLRKFSHWGLAKIIWYLPLLIFCEFVNHSQKSVLSVWQSFNLAYFSIYPSFFTMKTINKLINSCLSERKLFLKRVVTMNKFLKINIKLKSIYYISLS